MAGIFDFLIIGGGVTGTALARALLEKRPSARVALLEKEDRFAAHASGRNSGVLHAGYNQKPGTLKARFCVEGNRRLKEYCRARAVGLLENGILVVAQKASEIPVLEELLRRGRENGVAGLRLLEASELAALEPNAVAERALYAPSGAAVDAAGLVRRLAEDAAKQGATLLLRQDAGEIYADGEGFVVRASDGEIRAKCLVNCAGPHADRIAHRLGAGLEYAVVPFRGEFYYLDEAKAGLLRSMLYGAPDLEFPFLGVHWTRMFDGKVKIGPNAVLAPGREAYGRFEFRLKDMLEMGLDPRFWKMLTRPQFRRLAAENLRSSLSKDVFVARALALLKGVSPSDFRAGSSGIRAQIVDSSGRMVDDLLVERKGNALHVLNVVSPGLTCALPFADYLVGLLEG